MKNLMLTLLLTCFAVTPAMASEIAAETGSFVVADSHSVDAKENQGIGDERSEEAKQFGDQEHGKKKGHDKQKDKKDKKDKKKKKDKKDKKKKDKKEKSGDDDDDKDDDDDSDDDDDDDSDDDDDDDSDDKDD